MGLAVVVVVYCQRDVSCREQVMEEVQMTQIVTLIQFEVVLNNHLEVDMSQVAAAGVVVGLNLTVKDKSQVVGAEDDQPHVDEEEPQAMKRQMRQWVVDVDWVGRAGLRTGVEGGSRRTVDIYHH